MRVSFRDPLGEVFCIQDRIVRVINKDGVESFRRILKSKGIRFLEEKGFLVNSTVIESKDSNFAIFEPVPTLTESGKLWIEHEKIPFPSYPYEWPVEMLYSAADLTLKISQELISENIGIKDASPFNILFRGPNPIFIDLLSFEIRDPWDPIWIPYNQFHRTFLLPLLAYKYFGISPGDVFLLRREGFTVEEFWNICPLWRRALPPFFSLVTLPKWLSGKKQIDYSAEKRKKRVRDAEKSRFILEHFFSRLRKNLSGLKPHWKTSNWARYEQTNFHYSAEQKSRKKEVISKILKDSAIESVLDIGCNTGEFSKMAAKAGKRVVAIDKDREAVGQLWREATKNHLDILPLIVDISRPSPKLGWRYSEQMSFLDRATGKFDAVVALAIIHHLLVTERIPLEEIICLFSELTTKFLIVEYVGREDPMFLKITKGMDTLYSGFTQEYFEEICGKYFNQIQCFPLDGTFRALYLFSKRPIHG